jgi:hypothetical protein
VKLEYVDGVEFIDLKDLKEYKPLRRDKWDH